MPLSYYYYSDAHERCVPESVVVLIWFWFGALLVQVVQLHAKEPKQSIDFHTQRRTSHDFEL